MIMKRTSFIVLLLSLLLFTSFDAASQTKSRRQQKAGATATYNITGHKYASNSVKITDPGLAEKCDNISISLRFAVTLDFFSNTEFETSIKVYDISGMAVGPAKEMMEKMARDMEETVTIGYTIKKNLIYVADQESPIARVEDGGKRLTLLEFPLFSGAVLLRTE